MNDVNFVYGRDADVERLCNAVKDEEQHLCKLNKMPQGELSSLDDAEICDIDAPVASTVTARYYKGIGAHKDTMVLQARKVDAQSLRMVRTEEGKALRKAYESGEIHHAFNEHRTAEPRTDGISNTITTVQKDTMIIEQQIVAMRGRNPDNPSDRTPGAHLEQRLEPNEQGICNCLTSVSKDNMVLEKKSIKIRQATKDGFIDCEIGGASGFRLPIIRNTQRKSDKQRSDKSDTDNGEYP